MALVSSFGAAKIKASFDQRVKNREKYNGIVDINNFDVGKLIKNDSVGKVTLRANVKGIGLDPKTANASLDGTLVKAVYNKYTYKNLSLKGNIANGLFKAVANMKDPNAYFDLVANGSFKGKYPAVKMNLNLDSIDLKALNLYSTPLKLRGVVKADIKTVAFIETAISARLIIKKIKVYDLVIFVASLLEGEFNSVKATLHILL